MSGEPEHQPVMLEHEGRMSRLVAREAPLDEDSLGAAHIGPSDGSGLLNRKISCHVGLRTNIAGFW
jgi:hypothetical protein